VPPGVKPVSAATVAAWVAAISPAVVDGITVSGGEPFDQPEGLGELLTRVRGEPALEQVDILVYSGYPLKLLRRDHGPVLELLDAIISEPYVAGWPTDLRWRGSANQRLTLFTERARERYRTESGEPPPASLQVSVDAGRLWMTGIPRRGDMEKFEQMLDEAGVRLGRVSWRS
jgi:anaerobic ribonucleoside-triphosphate reductase activating protein